MAERLSIFSPGSYRSGTCGYCSPPGQRSIRASSYTTGADAYVLTCNVSSQLRKTCLFSIHPNRSDISNDDWSRLEEIWYLLLQTRKQTDLLSTLYNTVNSIIWLRGWITHQNYALLDSKFWISLLLGVKERFSTGMGFKISPQSPYSAKSQNPLQMESVCAWRRVGWRYSGGWHNPQPSKVRKLIILFEDCKSTPSWRWGQEIRRKRPLSRSST